MKTFKELVEKTLTPAEMKKREEIAKAMERENPDMEMGKKMAIATAAAKRVAEDVELEEQTAEAPSLQKHRIGVRVTNPNNKREVKYVVVTHSSDKKGAQAVGEKHFKKKNYAVHGSFHSGMVSEETELEEAGGFSYGANPARKGSVAYNALMKRKEQEKSQKLIEPKDQMVGTAKVVKEENHYMSKIEGGKGKDKGFGDKSTTIDDHLSAMNYHSGEYQKAMKEKRDSDARHHGMKYHKHKDQIERLGDVGNYRKEEVKLEESTDFDEGVDEAYMSSDRSKQMFKRKELDHELRHEVEPKRSEPTDPHAVHINGKKWKTFSTKSHATNVAKKIAGATVVKESEELDEATDHHAEAMEHKKQSDAAMDKNDMEAYHQHMSAHHESMGQWHESKGRSSNADKEFDKAEKHHELSLKKSNQKNEGTEMLSFKYFQQELDEAKKKTKESSCQMELAHGEMLDKDEDNGKEKKEMHVKEGQAPVAPGMKESVDLDEGDELAMRHKFVFNKTAAGKAREVARNREELKSQMKRQKEMGGITGPKGKLPEEVEIEEALKGDMHPDAGKVLKHIKPEHQDKYKPHLKNGVYKGNYADRSAVLSAAEKAGHTVNEAASPFDWKAYAKEKGTPSSNKTKTFHDVKKTSTGTVYTKQVNPDGTSKGSGDDAAKSAEVEQAPKRGRGRPAGVGAKTGSYKPRDPAAKAASAAKSAASKAANRASRNEEFDNEFMGSLIEGFEDEDFDEFLYCEEFDELDEATQEALMNFINEKCGYKMKESLTGKQHKLDKNKNGKIDSHDFKLLRKEAEEIEELSKKTLGSYVKSAAKDAEEAGRDQEYHGHKNDYKRGEKRQKGIEKAVDRLMKQETEQVHESVNTYAAFLTKKQ